LCRRGIPPENGAMQDDVSDLRVPLRERHTSDMRLTPDHVALSLRPEPDLGPDPTRPQHTEEELDDIAGRFDAECGGDPFWVFAYGSLIWKPGFESIEHRRATAHGWHRAFCLKMIRFRGTPDKPGLMLALARGGRCHGVIYRLPQDGRREQIRNVLLREGRFRDSVATTRWIDVTTADGPARALVFWAGPKGERVADKAPLEEVARILARACGHGGSCAEYLYKTVKHLDEFGIRDRNLWRLQELVAREIEAAHGGAGEGP
jgi:cation transport protein ChaC